MSMISVLVDAYHFSWYTIFIGYKNTLSEGNYIMHIQFIKNGLVKEVKSGFSWTTLFFPGFTQLFRGEVLLGLGLIFFDMFTLFIWGIVWSFIGNRYTARRLIKEGYVPLNTQHQYVQQALSNWGILHDGI